MWGKLGVSMTGLVGAAIQNVQNIGNELEAQMDAAVGVADGQTSPSPPSLTTLENDAIVDMTNSDKILKSGEMQDRKNQEVIAILNSDTVDNTSILSYPTSKVDPTLLNSDKDHDTIDANKTKFLRPNQENIIMGNKSTPGKKKQIRQKPQISPSPVIVEPIDCPETNSSSANASLSKPESFLEQAQVHNANKTPKAKGVSLVEVSTTDEETRLKGEAVVLSKSDSSQELSQDNEKKNLHALSLDEMLTKDLPPLTNEETRQQLKGNEDVPKDQKVSPLHMNDSKAVHFLESNISSSSTIGVVSELENSNKMLQQENSELKSKYTSSLASHQQEMSSLKEKMMEVTNMLNKTITEYNTCNAKICHLTDDIDKMSHVIVEKDGVIQSLTSTVSDMTNKLDGETKSGQLLSEELKELKATMKASAGNMSNVEADLRRDLTRVTETNRIQEERLQSFEREGAILAKKQGEMEKTSRKIRQEIEEKKNEIVKLKESKEQQAKTIEQMEEVNRRKDGEISTLQKSMTAIQAVSMASTEKIAKLENELVEKSNEILNFKKTIENSWNECNELKKVVNDLKGERDELQKELGHGANKVVETESTRRDLEHREAILRATNKQLQDSLQRQMQESVGREERMREELADTRKRWQDAITARESLASEMAEATTPLLRQITSTQENLRVKTEHWQKVENALSERALRAENLCDAAETRKHALEESNIQLKHANKMLTTKLEELQSLVTQMETTIETVKLQSTEDNKQLVELSNNYNKQVVTLREMEVRYSDMENMYQKRLSDMNDNMVSITKRTDVQIQSLQANVDSLTKANEHLKANSSMGQSSLPSSELHRDRTSSSGYSYNKQTSKSQGMDGLNSSGNGSSAGKGRAGLASGNENSFAASEMLHQQLLQKEEEVESLVMQVQQLQQSRNSLLEEVSYLSSKSMEYEEKMKAYPSLANDFNKLKDQNNTLLLLLGEKEEELEGLVEDMKDVKYLYRNEIESLMIRMNGSNSIGNDTPVGLVSTHKG